MKKFSLLVLVLLASLVTTAQQVINARRVNVSENFRAPIDTLLAPAYLNEQRFRLQDSAWYVNFGIIGKKWYKISVSPGDPLFFHDGAGKTYYVSAAGNNANHGLSPDFPWETIAKVNATDFGPGDKVLFRGGDTFAGTVRLTAEDKGGPGMPVVVSSYGAGRAKISSGNEIGVFLNSTEYTEIRNLEVYGTRGPVGNSAGIHIFQEQRVQDYLTHFVVDNCVVHGYFYHGINVSPWSYDVAADTIGTTKSFDSVIITNNEVYDNLVAGIYTDGDWPLHNNRNIYIAHNKSHHNPGNPALTTGPSGSGIVVSGFNGGVMEYNEAYENGAGASGFPAGGPVGIWAFDASHIIIQYNESHHNHEALLSGPGAKDGGGFDLDGGASKCIMQYNYSHDNSGPGYMIYDYGSTVMDSLVVRYNVSINDANHAPQYGAIYFGGAIAGNINKVYVYNNTIIIDTTIETIATPSPAGRAAINFTETLTIAVDSFFFYNNILYTNGVPTIQGNAPPLVSLGNSNLYWSPNPAEMNLNTLGKKLDPRFVQAGYVPSEIGVVELQPPYRNPFLTLIGYTPRGSSPAIDSAQIFLFNTPKHDIIGTHIMTLQDIGALEAIAPITPQTTETIDFASVGTNAFADVTLTVNGAADGDAIALGVPIAAYPAGTIYTAFVSATNTVTIRLLNPTAGAVNPPSAIFTVRIIR